MTATNFDAFQSDHKMPIGEESEARVRSLVNAYNGYLGIYKILDTSVLVHKRVHFLTQQNERSLKRSDFSKPVP